MPHCLHYVASGAPSRCARTPRAFPETVLFFVHIPKTAGTAFRFGTMQAFGKERVWFDYGPSSRSTHPTVLKHAYKRFDAGKLRAAALHRCSVLGGHVAASKYAALFGLRNTVTFVREPLPRMLSRFYREQRHVGQAGSFQSWWSAMKSRLFRISDLHVPFQAFGFVGLTERYNESLALLNAAYAVDIPTQLANVDSTTNKTASVEALRQDENVVESIAADTAVYNAIVAWYEERKRMAAACMPFVHGKLEEVSSGVARGWAWYADSDDAVDVGVLVDGRSAGRGRAELPHALAKLGAPRSGKVGFEIRLPVGASGTVRVQVTATGQLLGQMQL